MVGFRTIEATIGRIRTVVTTMDTTLAQDSPSVAAVPACTSVSDRRGIGQRVI